MNLPPLPELPTPFGVFPRTVLPIEHGMGGNTLVIEQRPVWSAEQINELLESYGRAVQAACARVADDLSNGFHSPYEYAEDVAAAIRNGVIREGEGE